ncbi:MAG TPA: hypothetical protein VEH31_02240 [Streptosporangiaceae bacterium]|nr:hypothetical protein [Streptosporangiaceae bacterium]
MFVVDEDRTVLEALAADLGRRFGADYQILRESAPVVQGVPGNMRQPAGAEQARRVALDGQGGQRREPEHLAGLYEQGRPAAVCHCKSEIYWNWAVRAADSR